MTKPITSVAVMMLYEEGRFLLDDPVSKYLPEFKNPKVLVKPAKGEPYSIPATKEITIRDLLRHTSGITYQWNEDLGPMYESAGVASGLLQYDGTIGDSVKHLAGLPLLFNPGDTLEYSLGVDVLGRLVEVVSGKPLDEFFRTRIFEPLGMKDTYFFPPDNKLDRLADCIHLLSGQRAEPLSGYADQRRDLSCIPQTILRVGRRNFSRAARGWFRLRWTTLASAR